MAWPHAATQSYSCGWEHAVAGDDTRATVNLFKEYGYAPVYSESEGGHTWINWRDYLSEFAPLLFR